MLMDLINLITISIDVKKSLVGRKIFQKPSQIAQNFSSSVDVDQVLYSQDIQGSIAYAEALMEAKVLSKNECNKIKTGLKKLKENRSWQFDWNPALEDVHMNIEAALEKEIGVTAKNFTQVDPGTIKS